MPRTLRPTSLVENDESIARGPSLHTASRKKYAKSRLAEGLQSTAAMNERILQTILRRALAVSLAAPIAAAMACGGRAGDVSDDGDASTVADAAGDSSRDAGGDVVYPDGGNCEGQGCGIFCPAFCTPYQRCVNGVFDCGCDCPDSGGGDSGDPCHPNHAQCPYYVPLYCTGSSVPDASSLDTATCQKLCDVSFTSVWCDLVGADGGNPEVACYAQCAVGRRPRGFSTRAADTTSALGLYFATAAQLEAASVFAFCTLREELAMHGAPARLGRLAERAANDEVRHARVTTALAKRFGARVPETKVARRARRSLEAIARENAVEGCVRETFGALVAMHQATAARDPKIRAAMERIAVDEARHAALAWQVASWIDERLSPKARARVSKARREAIRALRRELAIEPARALRDAAGMPARATSRTMLDALSRELWSARAA
jgi:hypothetical protein